MRTKPVLIVIAGPNGSGKTTITEQLLAHVWMQGCTYINPDIIAQEKHGGWDSPAATLKAAKEADQIRHDCLERKASLAFETVFRLPKRCGLSWKQRALGTLCDCSSSARTAPKLMLGASLEEDWKAATMCLSAKSLPVFPSPSPSAPRSFGGSIAPIYTTTPSTTSHLPSCFGRTMGNSCGNITISDLGPNRFFKG